VEFSMAVKLWRERIGAFAEFEDFWGIFVDFLSIWSGLGPNRK
jgi:hypothetical protein